MEENAALEGTAIAEIVRETLIQLRGSSSSPASPLVAQASSRASLASPPVAQASSRASLSSSQVPQASSTVNLNSTNTPRQYVIRSVTSSIQRHATGPGQWSIGSTAASVAPRQYVVAATQQPNIRGATPRQSMSAAVPRQVIPGATPRQHIPIATPQQYPVARPQTHYTITYENNPATPVSSPSLGQVVSTSHPHPHRNRYSASRRLMNMPTHASRKKVRTINRRFILLTDPKRSAALTSSEDQFLRNLPKGQEVIFDIVGLTTDMDFAALYNKMLELFPYYLKPGIGVTYLRLTRSCLLQEIIPEPGRLLTAEDLVSLCRHVIYVRPLLPHEEQDESIVDEPAAVEAGSPLAEREGNALTGSIGESFPEEAGAGASRLEGTCGAVANEAENFSPIGHESTPVIEEEYAEIVDDRVSEAPFAQSTPCSSLHLPSTSSGLMQQQTDFSVDLDSSDEEENPAKRFRSVNESNRTIGSEGASEIVPNGRKNDMSEFAKVLMDIYKSLRSDRKIIVGVMRSAPFESAVSFFEFVEDFQTLMTVEFSSKHGDERGVDGGGLTREFLSLNIECLRTMPMFEGPDYSKEIVFNLFCYGNKYYRTAGQIIALSLVHGAGGPMCFSKHFVQCLLNGVQNMDLNPSHIQAVTVEKVLSGLQDCESEEQLQELMQMHAEVISECYQSQQDIPGFESKLELSERIALHYSQHLTALACSQFLDGLSVLGIKDILLQHPNWLESVFVKSDVQLTASAIWELFEAERDEFEGSNRYNAEAATLILWLKFLTVAERGMLKVNLGDVLRFWTGTSKIPPRGFERKPRVTFLHHKVKPLPESSTCLCILRLPVDFTEVSKYRLFEKKMVQGIENGLKVFGDV